MRKAFLFIVLMLCMAIPLWAQDATPEPLPEVYMPEASMLESGWNTLVPGGETVCARGTGFQFFVRPAEDVMAAATATEEAMTEAEATAEADMSGDKLLIYFQGGGACWNNFTCEVAQTFDQVVDDAAQEVGFYNGIFDFENPANPVADYTFVFIPYCTGDIHLGDAVVTYGDDELYHSGYVNASAVLDWVYANYDAPTDIFVAGSSAGAYGAIFHAPYIINQYPEARVVQFGDAGVGVAPVGWDVLVNWGMYENMPPFVEALATVEPEVFSINTLYTSNLEAYPETVFSQFTTAADTVQIQFYQIIGEEFPWAEGMYANLEELEMFDNFTSYVAGGELHTILAQPEFYTYTVGDTSVRDWFASLVMGEPVESVRCEMCDMAEILEEE